MIHHTNGLKKIISIDTEKHFKNQLYIHDKIPQQTTDRRELPQTYKWHVKKSPADFILTG